MSDDFSNNHVGNVVFFFFLINRKEKLWDSLCFFGGGGERNTRFHRKRLFTFLFPSFCSALELLNSIT